MCSSQSVVLLLVITFRLPIQTTERLYPLKRRVVILQSNYIPWVGYFALIANSDVLVVLDSAKYTKNDWRNRNQLRGVNGLFWLTIPVDRHSVSRSIYDATVSDPRWVRKHLISIRETLSGLPHANDVFLAIDADFSAFRDEGSLHAINLRLIRTISEVLEIDTTIVLDREVVAMELLSRETDPTQRLVEICKSFGASSYLTGLKALQYLDYEKFKEAAIQVEVADYSKLPIYDQKYDGFIPNVSILDFLAAVGFPTARKIIGATNIVPGVY